VVSDKIGVARLSLLHKAKPATYPLTPGRRKTLIFFTKSQETYAQGSTRLIVFDKDTEVSLIRRVQISLKLSEILYQLSPMFFIMNLIASHLDSVPELTPQVQAATIATKIELHPQFMTRMLHNVAPAIVDMQNIQYMTSDIFLVVLKKMTLKKVRKASTRPANQLKPLVLVLVVAFGNSALSRIWGRERFSSL